VRDLIILGAELPDDATPEFTFHSQWPEPGHPTVPLDTALFDDPAEMTELMESFGLTVDAVRVLADPADLGLGLGAGHALDRR